MRLIGECLMAFETDQSVLKAAAVPVKDFQPPMAGGMVDIRSLDFPFDVQISAGLGAVPKQQKLATIQGLLTVGAQAGLPVDLIKGFKQATTLAGYDEEYFLLPEDQRESPPKPPEMTAKINIDLALLPPQMQQILLNAILQGSQKVEASVTGQMPKPAEEMMKATQMPMGPRTQPVGPEMPPQF